MIVLAVLLPVRSTTLRSNGCECLDLGGRQQDVAHAGTDGVVTRPSGFDDYMAGIIDNEGVVPATAV